MSQYQRLTAIGLRQMVYGPRIHAVNLARACAKVLPRGAGTALDKLERLRVSRDWRGDLGEDATGASVGPDSLLQQSPRNRTG